MEAYEEAGRSIGRVLMYDWSQEPYFWNLFKPLETWPRWYLYRFRTLYRRENVGERKVMEDKRVRRRKRMKELLEWNQEPENRLKDA